MEICKELADYLIIYAAALPDTKHGGNDENKAAYLKHVTKWQSRNYRKTIIDDAASVLPVPMSAFDQKPDLFNCKNGTLDLATMEFHKHDPTDFLTVMSGVKYDPKAKCTRWVQFIDEVTQGDKELAQYLQKAMGYGLCGHADEECLFILYGPTTRNGKSTAMEVYMKLVGGYGRTAEPETIAQRQHTNSSAPSEDLARLAGARVVNISEPEKQLVLSAARVKTLTGNDIVTARYLHENSFEFKPQFKLFINTNHLPRVNDLTVFSSGRVKVIPFNRHFTEVEQDRGLKRKLTSERSLSGILNWCLEGLRLMRKEGMEAPPSVAAAIKQYHGDRCGK